MKERTDVTKGHDFKLVGYTALGSRRWSCRKCYLLVISGESFLPCGYNRMLTQKEATEQFALILERLDKKDREEWLEGIFLLGDPLTKKILKKVCEPEKRQ